MAALCHQDLLPANWELCCKLCYGKSIILLAGGAANSFACTCCCEPGMPSCNLHNLQEEITAALAQLDPNGQMYNNTGGLTVGMPNDKRVSPDVFGGGAGQRCSMALYGGGGRSEYTASNRSSFDTQQV